MARPLMGVALLAGWLGVSAATHAQSPPVAPEGPGAAYPGAPAYPGAGPPGGGAVPGPDGWLPPAYPCGDGGGPPPLPLGPEPSAEALPANAFSTVHPEQVGRSPRFYLGTDYLRWWVRKSTVPALATTGNVADSVPGAEAQPGTHNIIGPGSFGAAEQSGVRASALFWFDQDHTLAVEASGFVLEERSATALLTGPGIDPNLVIARPFINPNAGGLPDADPIVVPGVQAGTLVISAPRWFYGGDANVRYETGLGAVLFDRVAFLGGVRYLALDEKLLFAEQVTGLPSTNGVVGNATNISDSFVTSNRFYGGQLGLEGQAHVGPVVFTLTGKVAVGQTREKVTISGASSLLDPGVGAFYDTTRGLLVQPTNEGRFARHEIGVVPTLDASLAWEFNPHVRVSLGYDFLYWSRVLRPGEQIDPIVNVGAIGATQQFGSSPHPLAPLHATGFWAQGVFVGMQVSY